MSTQEELAASSDVVQISEAHQRRLSALFAQRTVAWEALHAARLAQEAAAANYAHQHGKAMGGLEAILPEYGVDPATAIWQVVNGEVIVQRPPAAK